MSRDVSADMLDMNDIPEGWRLKPLKQVTRPSKVKVEPRQCPDKPYLSLEHIESVTTKILGRGTASDVRSTKAVFNAGDVLYGRLRPYLNKVARPDFDGVASTDILVFPAQQNLDQRYLLRFLNSAKVVDHAHHHSMGLQMPRIGFEVLGDIPIPLPPIHVQEQIADILENLIDQVDSARDRLATIPTLLKKFRQSVLAAACSGQLTADWRVDHIADKPAEHLLERIRQHRKTKFVASTQAVDEGVPRDWALTTVGQICAVATGATPLRTRAAYFGGDIPWITSSAVNEGTVTRASQFITELAVKETNAKIFPTGTLIVAMYGEGQTRGRVAELGIATATNQALAALLFDDVNESCRDFVKLHFLKNYGEMRNLAAGGVQPNLSLGLIRDSELLLPPLDEQAEIVQRVESLFALADSIEARLAEATAQVERTTQAILAKAFRGELT